MNIIVSFGFSVVESVLRSVYISMPGATSVSFRMVIVVAISCVVSKFGFKFEFRILYIKVLEQVEV